MTPEKPPTREDVAEIRERHKWAEERGQVMPTSHRDRADLLRRIDHLEAGLAAYRKLDAAPSGSCLLMSFAEEMAAWERIEKESGQ
ncbi:MAG: hypothetical protein HY369_00550 [Candidatus Aenigmarchaeota archaeon]|nr:hypothetical protein [Candidatus Aenigmarchaeota archaeon]